MMKHWHAYCLCKNGHGMVSQSSMTGLGHLNCLQEVEKYIAYGRGSVLEVGSQTGWHHCILQVDPVTCHYKCDADCPCLITSF